MNTGRNGRPSLLIFSFSDISNDGRVMRQVEEFSQSHEVTTYGHGPQPHPGVEHIRAYHQEPFWLKHVRALLWHLKWYWLAYWIEPDYRTARKALKKRTFDAVIANDLTAMGVISTTSPRSKVLLDLHEYWPGIQDNLEAWNRLRKPYYQWVLRTYGPGMDSYTVVSNAIAQRYEDEFGFQCRVVANSSVYREFRVGEVGTPIRLVHSGAAKPARRIDLMMKAVAASSADVIFDLYLTGVTSDYYKELELLSEQLGDKVRLRPPVPHNELIDTLHNYDVGVPFLPPTTTNLLLCLPNKFFDYVQARIAVLTGPTEAMVEITEEFELGVVTETFDETSLTRAIDELTPKAIATYKANTERAARELAGESQIQIWREIIDRISGRVL